MNDIQPVTGGLAQWRQYFAEKIGTIFVRNFFVGMEWKPRLRQAAGMFHEQEDKILWKN